MLFILFIYFEYLPKYRAEKLRRTPDYHFHVKPALLKFFAPAQAKEQQHTAEHRYKRPRGQYERNEHARSKRGKKHEHQP